MYTSSNAPPNASGQQPPLYPQHHQPTSSSYHENRRSGGSYKIPLGESYGAHFSPASSPYIDPSVRELTNTSNNLLGMSPYQSFSQSPPDPGRGGRGSKNFGQSPFAHSASPPEQRKGGKSQPLGTTPSRYAQQSPPKPITRSGKHNTSNNNLHSLIGTTPTSSSPKPRSPSGFPIRSPPNTHNNNNSNNNNKSPRQNTLYTPAQAVASISTPNIQQKPQNWTTPRRSNSYYNKANLNNQQQPQKTADGKEDGEGFMLFSPDDESSPTEPLPDTFSPFSVRNNTNNNTHSHTTNNTNNNDNNHGSTPNLPSVPDTT